MSPEVSIIIPVHRQWQYLPDLLAALAGQDDPARPEVIVVDNDPGSAEPRPALPAWVTRINCGTPGSYAARNAGAAVARGALLVFTDADCRPRPGWLATLRRATEQDPERLLAGPIDVPLPANPNRWQVFDAIRGIPQHRFIAHGYAATANLALPAALFRRLGGFDPGRMSGGDAEFCRRAGAQGYRLQLVPDAVVDHPPRDSLTALATQARRIKGGQVASGPPGRRLRWTLRSLMPPLRESLHYLASPHPLRHRLTAIRVRFGLWRIELAELGRLLLRGQPPERR